MKKNKGIIIELTALLDVIFIMLFWVMINVTQSNEDIKADAESMVAQAQADADSQVEQMKQDTQSQIDEIRRQASDDVSAAWASAESVNSNAAANQKALEGYEQGRVLTLNLRYFDAGEISISNGGIPIGTVKLGTAEEMYEGIAASLEKEGIKEDEVVMCAMVYDGNKALYKDVQDITEAVDMVGKKYDKLYCTYINTAR